MMIIQIVLKNQEFHSVDEEEEKTILESLHLLKKMNTGLYMTEYVMMPKVNG